MPAPALVILAAGLGTRFGGPKQLTPVGPRDEVILDYNAAHAWRAGLAPVVVVTRSALADRMIEHTASWPFEPIIVCQDLDSRAAGRATPLGTVHAALVGMDAVPGRAVALVNADDLYPPDTFGALAGVGTDITLVTFAVSATLLSDRAVTRALCDVNGSRLVGLEEGVVAGAEWRGRSGRVVALTGGERVSMNAWGLPPSCRDGLADFMTVPREGHEFALPDWVAAPLSARIRVDALASDGRCLGITHPDDLPLMRDQVTVPAWDR